MANDPIQPDALRNGSLRPPRPWYHLHASTYVVLLLTATVLFLLNVPGLRTADFGIHPYEPWRDRLPEEKTKIGARAVKTKQIMTDDLLVHGWPTKWLVREARWYRTASGGWRATKIWSLRESLRHFYPASLGLNIFVSLVVVAAVALVFERWRRRRRHLWQQTIRDWLGFIALAGAAIAIGLKTARNYRDEQVALSTVRRDAEGLLYGLREAQGQVYQSSGGPIDPSSDPDATSTPAPTTDDGDESESSGSGDAAPVADSGCGCRTTTSHAHAFAWLALASLVRRRRRQ